MTMQYKQYSDTIETFMPHTFRSKYFGWTEQVTVVEYGRRGRVFSANSGFASAHRGSLVSRSSLEITSMDRYDWQHLDVFVELYASDDAWFNRQRPSFSSYRSLGGGGGTVFTIDLDEASWEELKTDDDPFGALRVLHGVRRGEQKFEVDIFLHGRRPSI